MPELPEVETVVRGLREFIIGHVIQDVHINCTKSFFISEEMLTQVVKNQQIQAVDRRAKIILMHLDSSYTVAIHLKMTGQLVYRQQQGQQLRNFGAGHPTDSLINALPDRTTRTIFELDQHAKLFFNDMRRFGWIKLIPTVALDEEGFIRKLGPDALDVSPSTFVSLFQQRSKSIKACLLDQTIVAGCGNIYADESLWMSRIHPSRRANSLTEVQLKQLHQDLCTVLQLSIKQGGSSSRNYINAAGEKGKYLQDAHVYQKAGWPCKRCGVEIIRIVVANRGTHICPSCQQI